MKKPVTTAMNWSVPTELEIKQLLSVVSKEGYCPLVVTFDTTLQFRASSLQAYNFLQKWLTSHNSEPGSRSVYDPLGLFGYCLGLTVLAY